MNITLYQTTDEVNRLEKTLSNAIELVGSLRDECDILTPTIKVESATNLSVYNYMRVTDFGRYYFIKTIKVIRTGLWELTAEVDPLMSYAAQIKALPAIAGRSANRINYYISDGKQEVLSRARVQTKLFPKGFSGATYILTTAGGN